MMIKFLKHGKGSARAAANYVFSELDHKKNPRHGVHCLRGDPDIFAAIADGCGFSQRYTSGVIAFAPEDNPSEQEIDAVLQSFEQFAFAGLEPNDYHFLAVQHDEPNGSKHIHILVPRVHLTTQKSLNIAPPNWENSFYVWRNLWNETQGWADPSDPKRRRTVSPKFDILYLREQYDKRETARQILADIIEGQIHTGSIKNRADIEHFLRVDLADAVEVQRVTKRSISVKIRGEDGELSKQNLRLEGAFFNDEFDAEHWLTQEKTKRNTKENGGDDGGKPALDRERIKGLQSTLNSITEKRRERHREAYRAEQRAINSDSESPSQDIPGGVEQGEKTAESSSKNGNKTACLGVENPRFIVSNRDHLGGNSGVHSDPIRTLERADKVGSDDRRKQLFAAHRRRLDAVQRRAKSSAVQAEISLQNLLKELRKKYDDDTIRNAIIRAVREATERFYERLNVFAAATTRSAENTAKIARKTGQLDAGFRRTMTKNNDELNAFKSQINLVEYALSQGYSVDAKRTSQNSTYMRNANDERIVVATSAQGHGIYFTIGEGRDSGTIIDFVQNKQGLNLGQTRKALRPFAGLSQPTAAVKRVRASVEKAPELYKKPRVLNDAQQRLERLKAEYVSLKPYSNNYLLERGLSAETLSLFSKQIKQDERSNACFLHRNAAGGVIGWEKKNKDFTGFSSGGNKGLFIQKSDSNPTETVILFESAIDAMSFYELGYAKKGDEYIAIGGAPSPEQLQMLLERIKTSGAHVCVAFDKDAAGDALVARIAALLEKNNITNERITSRLNDWNDDLQNDLHDLQNNLGEQQYDKER